MRELNDLENTISKLMKDENFEVEKSKLEKLENRVDLLIEACEICEEVDNEDNMKIGGFAMDLLSSLSVLRVRNKNLRNSKWKLVDK